jgi:hypothetical protein
MLNFRSAIIKVIPLPRNRINISHSVDRSRLIGGENPARGEIYTGLRLFTGTKGTVRVRVPSHHVPKYTAYGPCFYRLIQ